MDNLIKDACIDAPDDRDFIFEDIFGSDQSVGGTQIISHKRTPVQDQSIDRNPSTGYACTCFSISHIIDEENAIEAEKFKEEIKVSVSGEELWGEALKLGAVIDFGWTLQGALNLAKDKGYIIGYSRLSGISQIKDALNLGQLISTGANCINWNESLSNNTAVFGPITYGHAFCIIGFDDIRQVLIAKNSYGKDRWDNGYFYINYSDIGKIYSTYGIVDKDNSDLFLEYKIQMEKEKNDKTIQNLVDLGITNGLNRTMTATREEVMLMIGRLVEKLNLTK